MSTSLHSRILVAAWVAALVACSDDRPSGASPGAIAAKRPNTAKSAPRDTIAPRPPQNAASATQESGGDVALASDSAPTARWLTDANLLAMLSGMSRMQTAAANIELQSWNSDAARAFAAGVHSDHSAILRSIDSVVTQLKVTPVMPALGQNVVEQMAARVDTISWFRGPLLDRAYVRRQTANLETMAQYAAQLAAAAERPEVQSVMTSAATRASALVSRGKALQLTLARADSMAAADSSAAREARRTRGARSRPASAATRDSVTRPDSVMVPQPTIRPDSASRPF